jgi:hypothetical protein
MIDFKIIVWLLPIVFMVHDFEEIIFFKSWMIKNKERLSEKFPRLSKRFFTRFENLSVQAFSLAVAEEFVLLSIVTVLSILFESYLLWVGVFMGFFIHLLVHLIQWIVFRKYIPAIYTSVISLIYCVFSLKFILQNNIFETKEIALWAFIGFGIVVVNLFFAHKLAELFDKKHNRHKV